MGLGLLALTTSAWAEIPTITSFTPTQGDYNTQVVVRGTALTGATKVTFNGVAATTYWVNSDTKLTAYVPKTASTSPIGVETPGGSASSTSNFTVTLSTGLSPTSGSPTSKVTVYALDFAPFAAVDLFFDTTNVALVIADAGGNFSGSIPVPALATPGTHWVSALQWFASGRQRAQSPFTVRTNWSSFHNGPNHCGYNPYENVLNIWDIARLDKRWAFPTGGSIISFPAVVDGVAYVDSYDGKLYAINASTGAQQWAFTTAGSIASSPTVIGNVVYVGSMDGHVYSIDGTTGAQKWAFATPSPVTSFPAVVGPARTSDTFSPASSGYSSAHGSL